MHTSPVAGGECLRCAVLKMSKHNWTFLQRFDLVQRFRGIKNCAYFKFISMKHISSIHVPTHWHIELVTNKRMLRDLKWPDKEHNGQRQTQLSRQRTTRTVLGRINQRFPFCVSKQPSAVQRRGINRCSRVPVIRRGWQVCLKEVNRDDLWVAF